MIILQCANAETKYFSLDEAVNQYNQINWRVISNNKIVDAKKGSWIRKGIYNESIIKVIGEAIGNCIAGMGEFKGKTSNDVITFAATPNDVKYKPENWNAVVLWNYLNILKCDYTNGVHRDMETVMGDVSKRVFDFYSTTYHINDLEGKLYDAIKDIKKYSLALNLDDEVERFVNQRAILRIEVRF